MLINPRFLPTVMIILSVLAAVAYAVNGDTRKAIYWAAGAVLNAAVTY
jgi:hypothetical protein